MPDPDGPDRDDPVTGSSASERWERIQPIDLGSFDSFVGGPLHDLIAAVETCGGIVRIVERDGAMLPITLDYAPKRVNASVVGPDDQVVAITGSG